MFGAEEMDQISGIQSVHEFDQIFNTQIFYICSLY